MKPTIESISPQNPLLDFIRTPDVDVSTEVWLLRFDREPAMVLGVITNTVLSSEAYLWSYAWPVVGQYKKTFMRISRRFVASLLADWPFLYGIDKGQTVWLRHLGATPGPDWQGHKTFVIR